MKKNLIVLALVVLFTGCADLKKEKHDARSAKEVEAPGLISESFVVQEGQTALGLKKVALDKEYLFQASLISQTMIPQLQGLRSRVVAFKRVDDKVYMLEATQGHKVTDELPQNLVLAGFRIVDETEDALFLDFNAGMAQTFMVGDWYAQDAQGSTYSASWESASFDVSYIEDLRLHSETSIEIRQIAQIVVEFFGSRSGTPVEVKYYLSPYRPTEGFSPTVSKSFERFGFFEVLPQLKEGSGEDIVYASKFNHTNPIVFAISANTPEDYKQAVKDGVLYWNKAFGSEVVQVIEAPEGVTAPDINYNVVQWVTWDNAGFAYADGQMDPRTGEIKHAQVFMTSAFAIGGKKSARRLLERLADEEKQGLTQISLKGFTQAPMCRFHPHADLRKALTELLAKDVDDAAILKASQDYVREVIAHEIGHTLGLRHNFAGSLHANYELADRDALAENYFEHGQAPDGVIASSSVMEYQLFLESILSGDLVARSEQAFPYDQKAIEALYLGKKHELDELPLFCSDSHAVSYADCQRFDAGKDNLSYLAANTADTLAILPAMVVETYVTAKEKNPDAHLANVSLSAATLAEFMSMGQMMLVPYLGNEVELIAVHRSFPYVNDLNREEVEETERKYIAAHVGRNGGVEKLFQMPKASDLQALQAAIKKQIDRVADKFNAEELALIRSETTKIITSLPEALAAKQIEVFAAITNLADHELSDHLAVAMYNSAKTILTASSGTLEETIEDTEGSREVSLPVFAYDFDLRLRAAKLLATERGNTIEWGIKERAQLKEEFQTLVDTAFGSSLDKADATKMPKVVARWLLESKKILSSM